MNTSPSEEEIGPFQIVVLVLSLAVLLTLLVDTTFELPAEVSRLLQGMDHAVCLILLVDFAIRFKRAKSKRVFMKWGWIDLVASLPTVDWLRLGRLVRVLRVLRVLRAMRLLHRIITLLFRNRIKGTLASAAVAVFLLLCFSSVSILICERTPEANITTAEDAVWWSAATITTVGYGDRYPVTTEGRFVAVVLMLSGLGLFGTISGLTASFFVGLPDDDLTDDILKEVHSLRQEISLLRLEQTLKATTPHETTRPSHAIVAAAPPLPS